MSKRVRDSRKPFRKKYNFPSHRRRPSPKPSFPPASAWAALAEKALERRRDLFETPATTAFRLIHGQGDGFPGVSVDLYGDVLVAHLYEGARETDVRNFAGWLAAQVHAKSVYLKVRPKQANILKTSEVKKLASDKPVWGQEVPECVVLENGIRYRIRPGEGLSTGLFLDMREARAAVSREARGKTVLNCFAYTCGFGLAALKGGASRVLNLDLSRRYLDWGMENMTLNGFKPDPHDFVSGDVFDWLKRFGRRGETFDRVILDPPSYSSSRQHRFTAERDYPMLVKLAAPVVASGGQMLVSTNAHQLGTEKFLKDVRDSVPAQAAKTVRITNEPSVDFPAVKKQNYLKICWISF